MKLLKTLLLVVGFTFIASLAQAADAARCIDAEQPPSLDLSDGSGMICLPAVYLDSSVIPAEKSVTCNVTFKDASGSVIDTQEFAGAPGAAFDFTVPADGVGSSEASCTIDSKTGALQTIAVIFPTDVAPTAPVMLGDGA